MHIYFAGAIRGGRDDSDLYGQLIAHLSQLGTVLTEHVGNDSLLKEEDALTEVEIFDRDMLWLAEADLVVAEVTVPSLGVGYELGVAEGLEKPVLCLFRPDSGRSLSAMVKGNGCFEVCSYAGYEEACGLIDQFLLKFRQALGQN